MRRRQSLHLQTQQHRLPRRKSGKQFGALHQPQLRPKLRHPVGRGSDLDRGGPGYSCRRGDYLQLLLRFGRIPELSVPVWIQSVRRLYRGRRAFSACAKAKSVEGTRWTCERLSTSFKTTKPGRLEFASRTRNFLPSYQNSNPPPIYGSAAPIVGSRQIRLLACCPVNCSCIGTLPTSSYTQISIACP